MRVVGQSISQSGFKLIKIMALRSGVSLSKMNQKQLRLTCQLSHSNISPFAPPSLKPHIVLILSFFVSFSCVLFIFCLEQPWESCVYSAEEESSFVSNYLGPILKNDWPALKIFGYDHNKDDLVEWADALLGEGSASAPYIDGIAFHWYYTPTSSLSFNFVRHLY